MLWVGELRYLPLIQPHSTMSCVPNVESNNSTSAISILAGTKRSSRWTHVHTPHWCTAQRRVAVVHTVDYKSLGKSQLSPEEVDF
jgi:hypothetical protein